MANRYEDARAHALRERYLATFGGDEIPVPVESIAEDLLGLRIEEAELGRLLGDAAAGRAPDRAERRRASRGRNDPPLRRHRFTIAHEIGHWVCHCLEGRAANLEPTYCRAADIANDVDRALEREANIFASELLMPEDACGGMGEGYVRGSRRSGGGMAAPRCVAERDGVAAL